MTSLRSASVWLLALLANESACSSNSGDGSESGARTSIRLAGGQTGAEGRGSCEAPAVEPPPIREADVRAFVVGRHETTLAFRAPTQAVDADLTHEEGQPLVVELSALGEAEERLGCGPHLLLPVSVKLAFSEPALDVLVDTTVDILSNQLAVLDIDLPFDISQQLGLRAVNHSSYEAKTLLRVWFGPGGVRGELTGNVCGSAVFPAGRVCTDGPSQERALDASLQAALDKITGLGELPVDWAEGASAGELPAEWADGVSTIHVTLEGQPTAACTRPLDTDSMPYETVVPLQAHVQSTDGRIDLHLPGQLTVREPDGDMKGRWDLRFALTLPAAALTAPATLDFTRDSDNLVDFFFGVSATEWQTPRTGLVVRAVAPDPEVEQPTAVVGSGSGTGAQCFELHSSASAGRAQ